MRRSFYLDLAAEEAAFPIGTDLVVHEAVDPVAVMLDGARLGRAVEQAALRFDTPLAFPQMDLRLEKEFLLSHVGIPAECRDTYHFEAPPSDEYVERVIAALEGPLSPRMRATCDALAYIDRHTSLVPVGMCLGPFSLMTKLLADPITPVYLIGAGAGPGEEPGVDLVQRAMRLSIGVILRYIRAQLDAGAQAIIVCEPAANTVYLSPNQMKADIGLFDRMVLENLRRIRSLLRSRDADLILHDCGELRDGMVAEFGKLDPAILSLGSSRRVWEDARLLPATTVLYGNLPSKHFYSDEMITCKQVVEKSRELRRRMRATGHPFILGSECDVLHVPAAAAQIRAKVDAFIATARADRPRHPAGCPCAA